MGLTAGSHGDRGDESGLTPSARVTLGAIRDPGQSEFQRGTGDRHKQLQPPYRAPRDSSDCDVQHQIPNSGLYPQT